MLNVPLTIGVDVGSVALKAVALSDGRPAAWLQEPTSTDIPAQSRGAVDQLRGRLEGEASPAAPVCATGYGRNLVAGADSRVSEIIANAVGAQWLAEHWAELGRVFGAQPRPLMLEGSLRTVVDVGGQDSKVIVFGEDGLLRDFAMNDRCAAGTGRFLEVMAGVLEVDIERLGQMALAAAEPARIASTCTVFAESEVVSLLGEGVPPDAVAAGVFESIAGQIASLAGRCGWRPTVLFDGGLSRSAAMRSALEHGLGCRLAVPPCGQFVTALGAALFAAGRE